MSENHNPNLPSSSSCSLGSHATRAPLASRSVSKAKKRGSTKIKRKVRSSVKGATRATLSSIVRRRWSKDEDEKLLRVVQKYGSEESDGSPRNDMWKEVAAEFKTRTPKACRDRWYRESFSKSKSNPTFLRLKEEPVENTATEPEFASSMKLTDAVHVGTDHEEHDRAVFSQPLRNDTMVKRGIEATPGTKDHDGKKPSVIRWSPFVFHKQDVGDSQQVQAIALVDESTINSGSYAGSIEIDLTPLDFCLDPDIDFTTNAILNLLCDGEEECNGEDDAPMPNHVASVPVHVPVPKPAPAKSVSHYGTEFNSVWCSGLMQQSFVATPHYQNENEIMKREDMCSPLRGVSEESESNSGDNFIYGTPPKYIIDTSPSSRYSVISSMTARTRTTMTRKKRRVANSFRRTPNTPSMPNLNGAVELDVVLTGTKPFFRLVGAQEGEEWNSSGFACETPRKGPTDATNSTGGTRRSDLFRILTESKPRLPPSTKGSRVSWSEPRSAVSSYFAATPHPPQTALKNFHSEPRRGLLSPTNLGPWKTEPRPNRLFVGKTPLMTLNPTICKKGYQSPTHDALVGMDLNRALFGFGSPATENHKSDIDTLLGDPYDF